MTNDSKRLMEILEDAFDWDIDEDNPIDGEAFGLSVISPSRLMTYYDVDEDSDWFETSAYYDCRERIEYKEFSEYFKELLEVLLRKIDIVCDWNWYGREYIEIAVVRRV